MANLSESTLKQYNDLANQYWWLNSQQFKDYVNSKQAWLYDTIAWQMKQQNNEQKAIVVNTTSNTNANNQNIEQKISSWDFTAKEAYDYNQSAWDNQGASKIMPTANTNTNTNEWINTNVNNTDPNTWLPRDIETWKAQWWNMDTLLKMIETQYGHKATYDPINNTITWVKNGVETKWSFDEAWNPIDEQILDANWNPKQISPPQPTQEDFFNTLLSGWSIPPEYKWSDEALRANYRFMLYNQYKGLTSKEYMPLLSTGIILPNTTLYNDLSKDPATLEALKEAQKFNAVNTSRDAKQEIENTENNQSDGAKRENPTLAWAMEDGELTWEEVNELLNNYNPSIKWKEEFVQETREEYLKWQRESEDIERAVDEELMWTWATMSYRNALIASRRRAIQPQLNYAYSRYQWAMWDLSETKKEAMALLNTNLGLYQQQQQRQWQLEDRADDRAYAEESAIKNLELQYQYTYWDLDSDNPTLQNIAIKNAVADLYKKYPINWMESEAIKEQKVKNLMAQWMSGSQAIAQVEQEIRNSESYKNMMNAQNNNWISDSPYWFANVWGGIIAVTNKETWEIEFKKADGSIAWWLNNLIQQNESWEYIQCWKLVNTMIWDITWTYGTMWDSYQSKLNTLNNIWASETPVAWWVFVSNPNSTNGHTWIVQNVNSDGSIVVLEANADWKTGQIQTNTYSKEQQEAMWMKFSQVIGEQNQEQDNNRKLTNTEWTQANQVITSFKTDAQVKAFEDAYIQWLSLLSSLNNASWPWDVAAIFQFMKTLDPASVVRESEFKVAAQSAGVFQYIWNTYDRLMKWEKLTDSQREAFWELAKQFVLDRAKLYDTKYEDSIRRLELQGIPTIYFPTNIANQMREVLNTENWRIPNQSSTWWRVPD